MGFDSNYKVAMNTGFEPAHWAKQRGQMFGNLGFIAAFGKNVSRCQAKLVQGVNEFRKFVRTTRCKNLDRMAVIVDFVCFKEVGGEIVS